MTHADTDKLVDELIDAKDEITNLLVALDAAEDSYTSLREDYMAMEQAHMVLMDEYADLARALGFSGDNLWGDVQVPREQIVAKAKELASFARAA